MIIRSQIDGQAIKNKEKFIYEIKTRALAPIRYDMPNYKDYLDYEVKQRVGKMESFELEFYDIIRSLLPKYFFQLYFGRMDGFFVAYHNTLQIFAFQYVLMGEVEKRLFGSSYFARMAVEISLSILKRILNEILEYYDNPDTLRIAFYAS